MTSPPCPRCATDRPSEDARFCARCGQRFDTADAADPLLGSVLLGRYRVTLKLGEGSMGRVYLGEQRVGEGVRRVAIKVLAASRGNDEYIVQRFRREATTLASLEHPNIVRLFDYGEEGGRFVSVMEFVPGESLATRVQRGRLEPELALDLAAQMAGALEAAHRHGVVHRDLKPENVLLSPRDPTPLLKVVDFGIARRAPAHANEKPLTSFGTVLGTPAFMCPEQLRGEPVDARADVYALGLLTYLMLAGTLPWPARTLAEWTDAHLNLAPTPLRRQAGCEALPPAIEAAVARALEKDSARRTPTAAAFIAELKGERVDEAAPVATVGSVATVSIASVPTAPGVYPPYTSPPSLLRGRRRALPWALGLVALGLGGGFALVSFALGRHDEGARAPTAPGVDAAGPRGPAVTTTTTPGEAVVDPVAHASAEAQAAARSALREGERRVRARDLDGAVAALRRAREPSVLLDREVDPLREAVDGLGTTEMRHLIHDGDCRRARALAERLRAVGAAAGAQARLDRSTCARR
ncbi:MAG: serine/threonine-protein kinase [Myxococcales bacterium]|nr:serine/threonine-protein kinase [Myxococcales bacterium]